MVWIVWGHTTFQPQWEWVVTVSVLSVTIAGLAWHRWDSLRSQLRESAYGELLRVTDPNEAEAKLPYFVAIVVALGSAFTAAITASIVEILSRPWAAVLLGLTCLLATWAGLGLVALVGISWAHYRMMARVEAAREATEASLREASEGPDQQPTPRETETDTQT